MQVVLCKLKWKADLYMLLQVKASIHIHSEYVSIDSSLFVFIWFCSGSYILIQGFYYYHHCRHEVYNFCFQNSVLKVALVGGLKLVCSMNKLYECSIFA